jgi:hypothetical protein
VTNRVVGITDSAVLHCIVVSQQTDVMVQARLFGVVRRMSAYHQIESICRSLFAVEHREGGHRPADPSVIFLSTSPQGIIPVGRI